MSEMFYSVGEPYSHVCKCGVHTTATKTRGVYGSEGQVTSKHDGPCGLPCIVAGVPALSYRTGKFHDTGKPCPNCRSAQ